MQTSAAATARVRAESVKELSGAGWARRFPGSVNTRDLHGTFRHAVEDFIAAMQAAGLKVAINATYRPIQRSYLMHWSWRIANEGLDAAEVPPMAGVEIEWVHGKTSESSRAARELAMALGIGGLRIRPALKSQHNFGLAIDMSISWGGNIDIADADGRKVKITGLPRSGMNRKLILVGATYGVKKYSGRGVDKPHWSNNGR